MRESVRVMRVMVIGMAAAVVLFIVSVFLPVSRTAALVPDAIPANGTSSARLIWSVENVFGCPVPFYPRETRVEIGSQGEMVRLVGSNRRVGGPAELELFLRAGTQPGNVSVALHDGGNVRLFNLRLLQANGDRDSDGMPDCVELVDKSDREAFCNWFVAIAEAQFYAQDRRWDRIHHDCAGLVRFAYKEALRRHDQAWLSKAQYLHRPAQRDVRRYNFPNLPTLGERAFRSSPGPYRPGDDVDRDFSPTASARVLWEYNTVFVGKTDRDARPGDLLFFRDPERHSAPMHSMVLLDGRVVYHSGDAHGEVRMVTIDELNTHKDDRWHVRPDNPSFLGFYRWKILEGGKP